VVATLESVGISVIGHPDRQLIDLYRKNLASGVLDEKRARGLIGLWMAPHDVKTFAKEREWPETSTCMMLGGCDEEGGLVWNELTRLFIETHCELNLLNPKLNCRIGADSPDEYLKLLAEKNLAGYNNFALINDDVLIPAQVRYGKSEREARLYVNGGCQETICEGVEHSAGAYYYFNMAETFHLFFCGAGMVDVQELHPSAREAVPVALQSASDFEEFYSKFLVELESAVAKGAEWSVANGVRFSEINPCPLFSATLEGCVAKAEDYKRGGAKYNPSGVSFVGFPDVVNSLHAVRKLVFEEESTTFEDFREVVARNWAGAEALRRRVLSLSRFGHGDSEVDELSRRLAADMARFVRRIPNERGERFQPSFFVYWSFKTFGDQTGATPDGRRSGDILSQGVAPHRENAPENLTDVIRSVSSIDFRDYPGNAVLDIQLPGGNAIPAKSLVALIRTAAMSGIPTLQLNCASREILEDARSHPERHSDLVVRISGLSAMFVKLNECVQDEIISRATYAA